MSLVQKLILSAMGQTLPDSSALSAIFKELKNTILISVIAAILMGVSITLGLYGFHELLISEGLNETAALWVSGGALLVAALISLLIAQRHIEKLVEETQQLSPLYSTKQNTPMQGESIEAILQAFIDGLMQKRTSKDSVSTELSIELVKDKRDKKT